MPLSHHHDTVRRTWNCLSIHHRIQKSFHPDPPDRFGHRNRLFLRQMYVIVVCLLVLPYIYLSTLQQHGSCMATVSQRWSSPADRGSFWERVLMYFCCFYLWLLPIYRSITNFLSLFVLPIDRYRNSSATTQQYQPDCGHWHLERSHYGSLLQLPRPHFCEKWRVAWSHEYTVGLQRSLQTAQRVKAPSITVRLCRYWWQ